MSKLHFGGHALRIARTRLLREWRLNYQVPQCWRCGGLIDPALSGLHPDGATVGHITPVSRGGDDAYENLALEHRRCNLGASNRIKPPNATIIDPIIPPFTTGASRFFVGHDGAALPPPSRRMVPE